MKQVMKGARRPRRNEDGQTIVELIAVVAFVAVVASLLLTSEIPSRILQLFTEQIDKIASLAG